MRMMTMMMTEMMIMTKMVTMMIMMMMMMMMMVAMMVRRLEGYNVQGSRFKGFCFVLFPQVIIVDRAERRRREARR